MMRVQPLLAFALACAVTGCKPSPESQVVGTWSGSGLTTTFKDDKTFTAELMGLTIGGTWLIDGGDVVSVPKTVNGQPVESVKESGEQFSSQSGGAGKQFIDSLDTSNVYTLSEDGKTLTTDKARDKNPGQPITMTKQGP